MVDIKNCVLALGYFDCIHLGHRFLLEKARSLAGKLKAPLIVSTFDDGFFDVLGQKKKEIYLLKERELLLRALHVDAVEVFPAERSFLTQSAEAFVDYLKRLEPRALVFGNDYSFGKGGTGNVEVLKQLLSGTDIQLLEVDLLLEMRKKIASADIRKLLSAGDLPTANRLLGEEFFVCGRVERGRGVGHQLGIPTANLSLSPYKLSPSFGVYATRTVIDGAIYRSLTNVGEKPTFDVKTANIETLIMDFSGDIYGKEIKVTFLRKLRNVKKFDSPQALIQQIKSDINEVNKD